MANKINLYDLMNMKRPMYPSMPIQPMPEQSMSMPIENIQPIEQPVIPQTYQRPVLDADIESQYKQELAPKKGFLAKYGFTPGVITQILGGAVALTGGNPYLAGGLAQSGEQLRGIEGQQEAQRKASLADYVKGIRGEQSAYDIAKMKAKQMMNLFPEGIPENMEIVGYGTTGAPMLRLKKESANVYQVDNEGNLVSVGNVEPTAKVFKKSLGLEGKLREAQAKADLKLRNLPREEEIKAETQIKTAVAKEQNVRAGKLGEMNSIIDFFEEKIDELPVGGGIGGKLTGTGLSIAGKAGLNAKAAAYEANLKGLRSQAARALGEVGNLSEPEQEAAMKLFPILSDNAETRKQKINNFREYVATKLSNNQYVNKPKQINKQPAQQVKSFNSPEDADKSGLPAGSIVMVNGRRYQI